MDVPLFGIWFDVPGPRTPGTAELLELRAKAAIDIEHRAGHERCAGAGEEHDAGGDFFRGAVALQRMLRALGFGEGAAVLRVHVGVDRARLQHVDRNAARAEVARCALAVADDRSLAGGVVGKARERGAGGDARTDGDDTSAFAHQLRCRAY